MQTGLTDSPRADTASPTAKTLRAALMSRSWTDPHSGQVHSRIFNGIFCMVWPQLEHRFVEGYHLSIPISSRPYHSDLYFSCLTNSDHPASAMDLESVRLRCMLLIARDSQQITWFSFISRVLSLCRKSLRVSAIFACSLATLFPRKPPLQFGKLRFVRAKCVRCRDFLAGR